MNPLRIGNKPGADTCHAVRSVLEFMSLSFSAIYSSEDDIMSAAMLGAAQIMNVCADALKEEEADEAHSEVLS